jgi:CBS domain containing-hemolysin-like protein
MVTFMVSLVFNLGSNSVLSFVSLTLGLVLLLFIILVGVIFDIVGVSATAGEEAPFHAMASKRVPGAKQAIWLVRNADSVSAFCNDLIGDVAGTLSGAVGVAIVFHVFNLGHLSAGLGETLANTFMVALIAALTVGGKSIGKNFAISHSTTILILVGRLLYSMERIGIRFGSAAAKNRKR